MDVRKLIDEAENYWELRTILLNTLDTAWEAYKDNPSMLGRIEDSIIDLIMEWGDGNSRR